MDHIGLTDNANAFTVAQLVLWHVCNQQYTAQMKSATPEELVAISYPVSFLDMKMKSCPSLKSANASAIVEVITSIEEEAFLLGDHCTNLRGRKML